MATPEVEVGASATDDDNGFTHAEAVLAEGDAPGPEPSVTDRSQTDPVPATSENVEAIKEQAEDDKKESAKGPHNLKSTFIISGVVVAVIGAVLAIVKKVREN